MSLVNVRRALLVALFATLVSACGGRGSSAPPPVGGITVTPGDNQVVVTWAPDPGVEYWLFYAPVTYLSNSSLSGVPGLKGLINVSTPLIVPGLTNGQLYSFTLDGRYDGGPGGPGTPSVSATPRLAGTAWTAGGALLGTADMHGVAWGAITPPGAASASNYYLAAGAGGALYQSTDGVTTAGLGWTQNTTSGIAANLNAAVYTLGKFIVVGDAGTISSSADLATWTAGTSINAQNLNAVASNGSRVVAVGNAGTIGYSADGISWFAAASVPTTNHLYGVSYLASGIWMAVGQNCTLLTSGDGSTWSSVVLPGTACSATDLKGAAYRAATTTTITIPTTTTTSTPAAYVVVGNAGLVLTSSDAANWTAQTLTTTNLLAVTPIYSQFLAVGAGGAVFSSQDGTAWTARTSGTASTLFGLTNAQGQFVAVGQAGTNLFSR